MGTKIIILFISLLCTHLFAQEEVRIKDGRIIIINSDGTWKYKQRISTDLSEKNECKSVMIGTQIWMVENLNVDHFSNGDPIPEAKSNIEWETAGKEKKPAWCYYDNNLENGKKYGKLYNWYAVNDKRGLAPKGWHIPSDDELATLGQSDNHDGNALKAIGFGKGEGIGTNTSGFSAMLSGERNSDNIFEGLDSYESFWSSTERDPIWAPYFQIYGDMKDMISGGFNKKCGFSVRCIKD